MAESSFGKNFAISSEVADAFVKEMAGDVLPTLPPGYVSHMEQLGDGELKQQISDALLRQ